ncbi:hypothetical protein K1719_044127 [Acacia pycnantha]|nr:hypothetical protein K1719_044127 [Acacia pycnantha]
MDFVASSSSSSSSKKHEVFLSFRGEDTRRSFTSHLYKSLCDEGIETFIDYDELQKGDDISQSFKQAIEDSSLSVIVFSETYASSKWCLIELIHILRCKEKEGQLVVPIFYQVDPSHVRHQSGAYEKAFEQHLKENPDKVDEWRKALSKTANLGGLDSSKYRDDAVLVQNIVNDIITKLNHGSTSALANIVGIDESCDVVGIDKNCDVVGIDKNCDVIESLLEGFSSIGIWGMGGIGKTTMAKLNYLKKEAPRFKHGSKVIITSRDRHVLVEGKVERVHEAIALSHDNSLELFNLKAFGKDEGDNKSDYKELIERALAYAQGVPLALTVLGSFLYSNAIKEWSRLEKMALPIIQDVLKLSYDGLLHEEKEIFLDIACFLKGESEEYVLAMLESFGFHGHISLRTLKDKALISVVHGKVWMHNLIQSMALKLFTKSIKQTERCRRLVNPDDIYDVLQNNRGSYAIQGISLGLSQIRDLQLSVDTFKKMTNLRFLKFSSWSERSCAVIHPSELDSFSESLRYLQWDNFPSQSLPLSFCAEKLVKFHMPDSHLKKLWDGVQNLVNLREIVLHGSKYLMELPDISTAQNLELLQLESCESLSHIDPSILSLPRLYEVSLRNCISLKSLKAEHQSKSVAFLYVDGCSSLKEFAFSSNKLRGLYLGGSVEILDFSIGHMEELRYFTLVGSKLKNLPIDDMICCMRSLVELRLIDCGEIIDKSKLDTLFDSLVMITSYSSAWWMEFANLQYQALM